ncbi:MAG: CAP domain-containing protein [Dehalococcoidia bacterium]|nr:CAP domain-containing protein [Dehalococcoidia bacterium]
MTPRGALLWPIAIPLVTLGATLLTAADPAPAATMAAAATPPVLYYPANGKVLDSLGLTLTWGPPPDTTQVHIQVLPANNDGPGIDLHLGAPETSLAVPEPPGWYGLLPDMGYAWRVRASNAAAMAPPGDPSWSAWSQRTFRTPRRDGSLITGVAPLNGFAVDTLTPTLAWADGRRDLFYYEVRVSRDPSFNTDPATAIAPVYSALLHGGVTAPANSYAVPRDSPLDNNTPYFWQARPRVQGDGAPVAWSPSSGFLTAAPGGLPPQWLAQVNQYRALGGLSPVIEHPLWSEGCLQHARYMASNDLITHAEDPAAAGYSLAGDECARNGNTFISGSTRTGDADGVRNWITGPFHAIGVLNPRLRQVGFGSATDDGGRVRYGAALDVWRGVDYRNPPGVAYPAPWPGDGAVSPLRSYNGSESPNPLSACEGYRAPTGAPVLLQLGAAVTDPAVTATTITLNGAPVEHCVFDHTTYTHPDPATQESGRAALGNGPQRGGADAAGAADRGEHLQCEHHGGGRHHRMELHRCAVNPAHGSPWS